ncbi:MAG: glycosyltransferase family A protein [Halieaceae bacterium]|nr:glycosyltransferase family A protein [Halieaceae bacterium]
MSAAPPLTIGLPVYNGENFIASALGSLLDQTFGDFEIIIGDNGSTDRTEEICRAFAASDTRISYTRHDTNLGAAANYNFVLDQARGDLFKWAAHDDVCLPHYLEECIAVLEHRPEVVLCHSRSVGIDDRGRVLGVYGHDVPFNDDDVAQRFWQAISIPHVCISVFGVMRRSILNRTIRHGDWVGADRNLLAQLTLFGKLEMVADTLFQRRDHAEASIRKFASEADRLAWFNPALKNKGGCPTWRRWQEYTKAVLNADLSVNDKTRCSLRLLAWLGANHHTGTPNYRLLFRELRQRQAKRSQSSGPQESERPA